jgi:methyl-accepting chemotaxis protein
MACVVLLTVGIVAFFIYWNDQSEKREFLVSLPSAERVEMIQLIKTGKEKSQRANDIYAKYWVQDGPGVSLLIVVGIGVSLFIGLAAAFLSARVFLQPLSSIIEASIRIAQGDLSVRAQAPGTSGELTDLIQNFNHMTDTLEQLERERKETTAIMSHELRTPLTICRVAYTHFATA